MQIVIEISDYDKEWITNGVYIPDEINRKIAEAIINGIPLPEHHGRLIDAKDVGEYLTLADVPTIIEAESEGEE